MAQTQVTVKIGPTERTYKLVKTTAPKCYDGFGTIEVYSCDSERWVVILADQYVWQTERYLSGLHSVTPSDDYLDYELAERMWSALALMAQVQ